jgi:hypothetical protein
MVIKVPVSLDILDPGVTPYFPKFDNALFNTKVVLEVNGEKNIENLLEGLKSKPADKII